MYRKDAIREAIDFLTENNGNPVVIATLADVLTQFEKPRTMSAEAKAKVSTKRKEATAKARTDEGAIVIPILKKYLNTPCTAKELVERAGSELPAGFTAPKAQSYLLRELAPVLTKTEAKGKPNTYVLTDR